MLVSEAPRRFESRTAQRELLGENKAFSTFSAE